VRISRLILLGYLLPWGFLSPSAWGQSLRDKVTLLKEEDGSRTRVMCTVLDHTGEYIRYQIREDGPTTTRPSSEVISIETSQTPQHIEALEKFAAGQTKEAITLFEAALKQDPRGWVRRDILAMLVKSALRLNNHAQAGERFLMIYASDKTTHHFKSIPLSWTMAAPSDQLKTAALQWMNQGSPAAKLLAASSLLFDPKYQSSAKLDLQQLRSNPDPRVRYLAIAQLWRLELPDRKIDTTALDGWQNTIRNMPADLRGGAYFLLGEGRKQRLQYDRAAVALLWVPLVYDHDYQLSALASLNAADALNAIGQREEALAVYREIVVRYGQSSYAQDAAQILKSLEIDPATGDSSDP
jgi:tetratricopeptide (TPR) repeat protein